MLSGLVEAYWVLGLLYGPPSLLQSCEIVRAITDYRAVERCVKGPCCKGGDACNAVNVVVVRAFVRQVDRGKGDRIKNNKGVITK